MKCNEYVGQMQTVSIFVPKPIAWFYRAHIQHLQEFKIGLNFLTFLNMIDNILIARFFKKKINTRQNDPFFKLFHFKCLNLLFFFIKKC